jgi:hypothetical protein
MPSQQATEVGGELPGHINENLSSPPIEEGISQEGETNPIELAEDFAAVVQGYPTTLVESAIVLADTQPRCQQLWAWYEAVLKDTASSSPLSEKPSIEVSLDTSERPPLDAYEQGQEVWAYFPQTEKKWLRATVEWVRHNLVRVKSGFFGMLIERAELIAPGDWEVLTS